MPEVVLKSQDMSAHHNKNLFVQDVSGAVVHPYDRPSPNSVTAGWH